MPTAYDRAGRTQYLTRYQPSKARALAQRRARYAAKQAKIMPSKRLEAYPSWMLSLAASFEPPESVKHKTYVLSSPKAAKQLRAQFYGFINAIHNAGAMSMYPNFITVRIAIDGSKLHIQHVDEVLPEPEAE